MTTEEMFRWADCGVLNCPYKVCLWGSFNKCFPHEAALVGQDEMEVRFNMTHEYNWGSTKDPNYMTRTFAGIRN